MLDQDPTLYMLNMALDFQILIQLIYFKLKLIHLKPSWFCDKDLVIIEIYYRCIFAIKFQLYKNSLLSLLVYKG